MLLVELRKLVGRPRTWVTIALLAGLPTLVAVFLRVTEVGPRPGQGPAFLAEVLNNGALFLAVLVVAGVAFAIGAWLFGVKPLPAVSGQTIAAQDATWRTAVTVAYVAWSMLGVAAVALFASTVTDSPLAAALGALAALVTSQVLDLLDPATPAQSSAMTASSCRWWRTKSWPTTSPWPGTTVAAARSSRRSTVAGHSSGNASS